MIFGMEVSKNRENLGVFDRKMVKNVSFLTPRKF